MASPPVDLRYLERPLQRVSGDSRRAQVVSFLEGLYSSVPETLPDVKDDTMEITFDGSGAADSEDAYADALSLTRDDLTSVTAPTRGTKRIRTKIKSVRMNEGRHPLHSGLEVRWLPPGSIKDYWEQLRASDEEENISFSYFWRGTCAMKPSHAFGIPLCCVTLQKQKFLFIAS